MNAARLDPAGTADAAGPLAASIGVLLIMWDGSVGQADHLSSETRA